MYLKDIAMIAADTSRTLFYLTKLLENDLLPNFVILFLNESDSLKPGQNNIDTKNELLDLLRKEKIMFHVAENNDINSNEVISLVKKRKESFFIYSGFGGVLLRDGILDTGKNFLHVHGGYLPNYKGSTTNYYSLINDNAIGASSIFLTKDIDCGPVIMRKKFPPPTDRTLVDHIHDSAARSNVLIETLKRYISNGKFEFELEENKGGETFYIIHPVLKHISILGE